eukprot:SAG11_NODE_42047_length_185_cov_154.790698_1_plen_55_part_10
MASAEGEPEAEEPVPTRIWNGYSDWRTNADGTPQDPPADRLCNSKASVDRFIHMK